MDSKNDAKFEISTIYTQHIDCEKTKATSLKFQQNQCNHLDTSLIIFIPIIFFQFIAFFGMDQTDK